MFLGYNTNGFAHHRLEDTFAILADLGYQGVAITLDYFSLNPFAADWLQQTKLVAKSLERYHLKSVIETGARFLLNPREKHHPTLLSADATERQLRRDFLLRSMEIAHELGGVPVSFWSGQAPAPNGDAELWPRLLHEMELLLPNAERYQVRLAFEPEPGMFIETMAEFAQLHQQVNHPAFGLTLDVGHLQCMGELPLSMHIQSFAAQLWNVHLEDMNRGVHDHLMFGEGEIDFNEVFAALQLANYSDGLYVELSRHSHDAVRTAQKSAQFLKPFLT